VITVLQFNNLLTEPLHSTGIPTKKVQDRSITGMGTITVIFWTVIFQYVNAIHFKASKPLFPVLYGSHCLIL